MKAAALVGSWARGTARADSDVDIVVLTTEPSRYIESDEWARTLGIESFVGTKAWGVLTERRAMSRGGIEVEFGFAPPSWAANDPAEAGTMRVVRDGMRILYDPSGLLARLSR